MSEDGLVSVRSALSARDTIARIEAELAAREGRDSFRQDRSRRGRHCGRHDIAPDHIDYFRQRKRGHAAHAGLSAEGRCPSADRPACRQCSPHLRDMQREQVRPKADRGDLCTTRRLPAAAKKGLAALLSCHV
jgi:hypothetical protein